MAAQNSSQSREFSGKNVDVAVETGLQSMGLEAHQVDVEILRRGSRGILGIGSEDAIVRLTPIASPPAAPKASVAESKPADISPIPEVAPPPKVNPAPISSPPQAARAEAVEMADEESGDDEDWDDGAEESVAADDETESVAVELLSGLLEHMGIPAQIEATWESGDEGDPILNLDVQGQDLGMLIGRHGKTLSSIQFLLRLMINQRIRQWPNVVVDVEQYKVRHRNGITVMAQRMADQVVASGASVFLEPMPPADRRLVHIALRDHPQVETQSVGDGERRKVQILLKESQA